MTDLKVGLIGAGVFGGYHAGKAIASNRASLAGVYDPSKERADELCQKFDTDRFETESDLYAACDAVIVATPATYHFEYVQRALKTGLHVLVEKPLALSGTEAQALAHLAEEKDLVLQVGHQERLVLDAMGFFSIEEMPIAIEAVREGPPAPGGRASDVSVIWDLMIHDLDLVAKLMGNGAEARGQGAIHHTRHVDEAVAELRFADGGTAKVKASRAADERQRSMRVTYPSGAVHVDFLTRKVENSTPHAITGDVSETLPDPLGAADEAFYAACRRERDILIPGRGAVEAVRLAEMVERSALAEIWA